MATIDEEILYDKENKLGLTTFTFRSQRYSIPSVIVKSDTKSEGVCVMLDVGLFCPYCSGGGSTNTKYTHKRCRLSIGKKLIKSQMEQQKLDNLQKQLKMIKSDESSVTESHHQPADSMMPSDYPAMSEHIVYGDASQTNTECFMSESPSKKSRLIDKTHLAKPDLSALDIIAKKTHSDMDQKLSVLPKTKPALVYTGEPVTSSLDTQIHSCVKSKIGEVQQGQQSPLKSLVVTAPQMHSCMKPQTVSTQQKQSTVKTGFPYKDPIGHTSHTQPNKGKPYDKGKKVKPKVPPKPGRLATKEKQLSIPALKDLASDVVTGAHFYPFEDSDNSPEILQEFTSSKEVDEFENTLLTQKEDKKSIGSQRFEVETGLMAHNNANKSNLLKGGQEKLVDYENNHNISSPTLKDQSNLVRKQDHFKHKWDNNTKDMKHNNPGHTKSISIQNIESSEKSVKIASGDRVTNLCSKTPSVIQHRPQNDDVYVVNGNQTNLKHDSDQSGNGEIMVDLCLSKDINIKDHSKQKLNYEINMDKQQREKCINQSINKYSVQHQDSDLIGYCVDNNQNSNSCTSYHKSDEKLWSRDEGTDSDTSSLYKKSAENLLVSHSFDTGSDTYLMDELLTDSVISEDPDFKDVDENTLIAIERKLMQDLASLETQESKNREKVSVEDVKNSQQVHLTAFNKDNVNTLENKNNVKLSSEKDLNSDNKLKEMDLHDSNNEIGLKEKEYSVTHVKNTVKALERNNNNNIEPSVDMKVTTATSVKTDNIINGVNSKNSDIQNGNHGKRSEKLVKKLPPPVPKKRSMKFEPIGVNENVSVSSKRSEMDRQSERRRKNHDDGSRPRDRCRSASPEIMMEEILDHLDDTETETFSGDVTLGRVFSVRREKKYLTLGSDNESQRNSGTSPLQGASEDIGEFYEFMKEMQNAEVEKVTSPDKPKEHNRGRKKIFTVGEREGESTENLCEVNVKVSASPNDDEKFGSLNDLLDEEISCAKELNETFSVTDTHHESVTEVHQSLSSDHGKELDQTATTIGDDSVFNSTLKADEMFENAFENALEDIGDEEQLKEWTSDYESDVKGSNNTSNSASLDRNTSEDNEANQIYQQYLKSLESPTKFQKKPSSSIECNVGDRSQSVLSEVASTENQTPSRESYSRGSLSSGCSYTDEEVNVPEISNIPFEQIILDTNRLTKDIIGSDSRKKETIDDNSNISKFVKMDELNIETTHQEMVINQEELFHSPGSICPPKSPNIVQKPHVLLAKTQKIPLISTTNNNVVHSAESVYPEQKESSIESENVYVTQEDIMNPDINKFIEANIQNNQQNLFRRQPSIDEMSEGSTMSSIDEFIPETEEPNAPPVVMQQPYDAAIQVAQMFQHHHVTHPCFQKILEEISSSRESLLISDSEGSRSNTLRRNPLAKKPPIKEETEKENVKEEYFINVEEENKGSEVILQSSNDQVISENRNDILVSQGHAQQFLQHVMGSDHKEEKEKQLEGVDKHEECHSCVVKSDEGTVVKSEVVSTEEVTLVFAWPKSMGTNFLKANPNLPFRQLHMHRVLKTDDMNVEILEGPSLKSITQKMVSNKAIDQSKTKTSKDSNTAKQGTSDIVATSYSTEENIVSRRDDEKIKEKNDQIIADIDVKVKSTKFTPKGSTVVVERQTKEEGELVESITENIVKVLSQNNTVEYNDQQLSLEHKDSVNQLKALPQPEPDDILNTN